MKKEKKYTMFIYMLVAVCVLVSGGIYSVRRYTNLSVEEKIKNEEISIVEIPENGTINRGSIMTPTPIPVIYVHVCGSVEVPGVVRLYKNSRVIDAVKAAGGFSEFADENYINQAKELSDGERIYIPSRDDVMQLSLEDRILGESLTATDSAFEENATGHLASKVNINKASIIELTSLPGIGESRAKDIVAYRTKVGLFEKIEDIMNVSGIGNAMFEKIKAFIYI